MMKKSKLVTEGGDPSLTLSYHYHYILILRQHFILSPIDPEINRVLSGTSFYLV